MISEREYTLFCIWQIFLVTRWHQEIFSSVGQGHLQLLVPNFCWTEQQSWHLELTGLDTNSQLKINADGKKLYTSADQ